MQATVRRPTTLRRIAPLLILIPALTACLQRLAVPAPDATPLAVATVPAGFFAATPAASCCPPSAAPSPFPGRYQLGAVEALPRDDQRAVYAVPLLGSDTKFIQISLQIAELPEPRTPPFAYELITETGVFGALASGEWEAAVGTAATYRQEGVLLFVVPRNLREARLEIVEYGYPRPAPGETFALRRAVIAAFDLPRLP